MKFPQKIVVGLVAFSLLLGNLPLTVLNIQPKIAYAQEDSADSVLSNVTKEEAENFKANDKVKIIVKLKEQAVDPEQLKSEEGRKEREESTKAPREQALKDIQAAGISYKKLFDYNLLFNGFSLETSFKDAKKIQNLDFVDSVELSVEYEKPQVASAVTEEGIITDPAYGKALDSSNLINVQPLWDKGIKGQGRVVSVIDSGIDPDHEILRLTDTSKAKYRKKSSLERAKRAAGITYGKWYSDKLVYAFNYNDWDDQIKESDERSHGMHVAGTAVGNPQKKAKQGDYVTGVAPEAQLIFMRVFSDRKGKGLTSSYIYAKAIEDSVKLGADTINLSLGSVTGSVLEEGDAVTEAIELAKQSGVSVIIAAGNSGTFGDGHSTPKASNPDYGVVGSPSVAADAISVAALSNSVLSQEILTVKQLADNAAFNNGKTPMTSYKTLFDPSKDYDYVYVGLGKESDYEGKDVKGKVALIKRGELTFVNKAKIAKEKGASGVLLFNHEAGGEATLGIAWDGLDSDFPIASIGYSFGNELSQHADSYKLTFTGEYGKYDHPEKGQLTTFSSWGMSSDGQLKPDVTAPGGDILSAFNNNGYGLSSGTSMASPHVAGATSLVKQVLAKRFRKVTGQELQKLVKHLVMSTANPNFNETTQAYTSPRQQGAGVMDTAKAAYSNLYVTGEDDYGSISLGNVGDTFTLNLVVHNLSRKPQDLVYTTYLNTDQVENGNMTLKPRQLDAISGGQRVTVPAKGQLKLSIPIDATRFSTELQGLMPNGYFLEGFVKFFDANDNSQELVSIPYVGFRGEFQNLPVVEKPIYNFTNDEKPFYSELYTLGDWSSDSAMNFTTLVTVTKSGKRSVRKVLGGYTDPKTGQGYFSKLALSPNGDGDLDEVAFKGVFLRNYENLKVTVYAKDDVQRQNPLFSQGNASGRKNYYDSNPNNRKSSLINDTIWGGLDNQGNPLPDGEYQYVVSYNPTVTGAKTQEMAFNIIIDRIAPKIDGTGGVYNEATRTFTPYPVKEAGSGILYKKLTYKAKVKDDSGKEIEQELTVPENMDGSYTLLEGVDLEQFNFEVGDFANNKDSVGLSAVQKTAKGTVEVKLTSKDKTADYSYDVRYKITNEKGEIVSEDFTKNGKTLQALPFGKYKVELVLMDEALKLLSPKEVTFELTKENASQEVEFLFEELIKNTTIVRFDKPVPTGTKVYAINAETGRKTELPASKYSTSEFQKQLYNGTYTLEIALPEGFSSSANGMTFEVGNQRNEINVSFEAAEEANWIETTDNAAVKGSVQFEDKVADNDLVFSIKEPATKDKEAIKAELEKAVLNLNQYDLVYYNLSLERDNQVVKIDQQRTVQLALGNTAAPAYLYHQKEDGSLELVQNAAKQGDVLVFSVESFSNFVSLVPKGAQAEQDEASSIDKTNLQAAVEEVKAITETEGYDYASLEAKTAYQQAIVAGRDLLSDEQADQEAVNQAVADVETAKAGLTGQKSESTNDSQQVNKKDLTDELEQAEQVLARSAYATSSPEAKTNYDKAIQAASQVAKEADASQASVDQSLADLRNARSGLNNQGALAQSPQAEEDPNLASAEESSQERALPATAQTSTSPARADKKALSEELDKYQVIVQGADYKQASQKEQASYEAAAQAAKEVIADPNADQGTVDQSLANLKKAEEPVTPKKDLFGGGGAESIQAPTSKLASKSNSQGKGKLPSTGEDKSAIFILGVSILLGASFLLKKTREC